MTIENAGGRSQVVVTYALTTPDPPRRELDARSQIMMEAMITVAW